MHMRAHITGSAQCPGCSCTDETFDHLFRCTHKALRAKREEMMLNLRKKLLKLGFPRAVMEALCKLLMEYMAGTTPEVPTHEGLARAVTSQSEIGLHLLPRGIISVEWTRLLQDFSVEHPDRVMAGFLKTIWLDYVDQIWRCRNDIAHESHNLNRKADEGTWASKLLWYLQNTHTIAPADQFLLQYSEEDVQRMTGYSRKRLVKNLDTVQAAYRMEMSQRQKGQNVITQYFERKHQG